MDKRKDLLVALAFAVFGVLVVIFAFDIPPGRIRDPIGPRTLPMLTGALIILGGGGIALRRVLSWRTDPLVVPMEGSSDDQPDQPASTVRAMIMWVLCLAYALALSSLGFLILTPVLLVAMLVIMGIRNPLKVGVMAVAATVLTFALFDELLKVRLPLGPLDGML